MPTVVVDRILAIAKVELVMIAVPAAIQDIVAGPAVVGVAVDADAVKDAPTVLVATQHIVSCATWPWM